MALPFTELLSRMVQTESGGNPNAVSPRGASGLMQIMPATAADPGFGVTPLAWENVLDPVANRRFGEEYMTALLDHFGGDQARALVAYNWGPGNAKNWDGDVASLPAETQGYLAKILGPRMETHGNIRGAYDVQGNVLNSSPRPVARPTVNFPAMIADALTPAQPAPAQVNPSIRHNPQDLTALLEEITNAANFR